LEVSAQHNELSSFDILVYQRFASTSQQIAGCADRHKVNPTDAGAYTDRDRPSPNKLRDGTRRLNPNMHRYGWESRPERFNRIDDTIGWKHSIQGDKKLRLEHLAQASHLRRQTNDVGDDRPRLGEHRPAGLRQQRLSGVVPF
jgi:hypothetical protein